MIRMFHPIYDKYCAYEDGTIESLVDKVPKKLKPILHHTGYSVLTLPIKEGKRKQARWHRFVWECFFGEIPNDRIINHKNGIKTDNNIRNLEIITHKENIVHAHELGLAKGQAGEKNSMAKLSKQAAIELIEGCISGKSNDELGLLFNLHPRYISLIRNKRRWKKLWDEYLETKGSETIP